jgi:hypothetical protein
MNQTTNFKAAVNAYSPISADIDENWSYTGIMREQPTIRLNGEKIRFQVQHPTEPMHDEEDLNDSPKFHNLIKLGAFKSFSYDRKDHRIYIQNHKSHGILKLILSFYMGPNPIMPVRIPGLPAFVKKYIDIGKENIWAGEQPGLNRRIFQAPYTRRIDLHSNEEVEEFKIKKALLKHDPIKNKLWHKHPCWERNISYGIDVAELVNYNWKRYQLDGYRKLNNLVNSVSSSYLQRKTKRLVRTPTTIPWNVGYMKIYVPEPKELLECEDMPLPTAKRCCDKWEN